MEDDIFLINVQIGGLRLPLRIARKDEELYRKAEKLLVKQLEIFQVKYRQRPTEDILILVAYQLAVMVSKQELSEDTVPLAEKIQSLDNELKALLSKE
ncbi:MAG: cell division protein ZapA [Paludibacter sp.]|jgi:cell division protein ZapA|nr:cell division protein ZapA [Paludibacter sp.]